MHRPQRFNEHVWLPVDAVTGAEAGVCPHCEPYNGTYKEDDNGETITIQLENDQLLLHLHDNDDNVREGVCIPISETQFPWAGGLIEFQVAEDGTVPTLTAMKVYTFRRL